jgi:hypothetical protein
VGAVVDWYAVVLTDKLWTPDNAPAIIDTRSTLFHELESLLIEVQDDPAMSGTLNVELDGVDLSQPAPVSLESLATRLEQAMQSAWAKAAELGKEYPMVEESRPVEQDVQEQLDDLEVEETSLRAEVAKDRRRANLILRNTEATVEGDNARAQAERLLARANANETKASGLSKEATRLRMGTDSIATRVRLLASNPRLQGSAKRAIGPAD